MNERLAEAVAQGWKGGGGLVARGPRRLLSWAPADPADVGRHVGITVRDGDLWRVQVAGRFIQSGGLIYPGGVPFPEDLAGEVAVVTNEVWLYVDAGRRAVIGQHWWPEAMRKPVASAPRAEFHQRDLMSLEEAGTRLRLSLPQDVPWEPGPFVGLPQGGILVMFTCGLLPEPLNEMVLLEGGGLSLRARPASTGPAPEAVLEAGSPPFRRLDAGGFLGVGREPGRTLGPHTWPWPAELLWRNGDMTYQLRGHTELGVLQGVAAAC